MLADILGAGVIEPIAWAGAGAPRDDQARRERDRRPLATPALKRSSYASARG